MLRLLRRKRFPCLASSKHSPHSPAGLICSIDRSNYRVTVDKIEKMSQVLRLAVCLTAIAFSCSAAAQLQLQQQQQQQQQQPLPQPTGVFEQPSIVTFLQGLGLEVDQNTVIIFIVGTILLACIAVGLDVVFLLLLLFGRPMLHQIAAQMNGGQPGVNPMDGLMAASSNAFRNLVGSQDLTSIVGKLISAVLPSLLRTTSQFVTDQANMASNAQG